MVTTSSTTTRDPRRRAAVPRSGAAAVGLGLLAHDEGLHVGAAGQRGAGAGRRPSSCRRRRSRPRPRALGDELAQRAEAGRAQDRPLGVDVVLRLWRRWSGSTSPSTRACARSSAMRRSAADMRARTLSGVFEGSSARRRVASACVLLWFLLFAIDESSTASSQDAIAGRSASRTTDPRPVRSAPASARTRSRARRSTTSTTCSGSRSRGPSRRAATAGPARRPRCSSRSSSTAWARASSPACRAARYRRSAVDVHAVAVAHPVEDRQRLGHRHAQAAVAGGVGGTDA